MIRRSCQGAPGCKCALDIDAATGEGKFDPTGCLLHSVKAEVEVLGDGVAWWFDGICTFCQQGASRASARGRTGAGRSVKRDAAAVRIAFDELNRGDLVTETGFGELRHGLRTRSAALRTTDYVVRENTAAPADTVSALLRTPPRRPRAAQISAAASVRQAGERMRQQERSQAEAEAAVAVAAAAKAEEEAAALKRRLQSVETAFDQQATAFDAEQTARKKLEAELAAEQSARAAAEVAESDWKRRYEEELRERKAAAAARDAATAERDDARELMAISEEDTQRARGLWVAAAWKAAWDRKQRDHARAEAAAANEKAARVGVASTADREARATAEAIAKTDKHEREQAAARALLDRQMREAAEQRAKDEADARALLAESCARAVADAENAQKATEAGLAAVEAAKARAEAAEVAERVANTEANDAKGRYQAAALELASAMSEIARLQAMLGETGAASDQAMHAQRQATALVEAGLAAERASREAAELEANKSRERAEAAEAKAARAASSTWQIAMLRTQIDVLRSARDQLEERLQELRPAREKAETMLSEAIARTAEAEANMERAQDDAVAAREELAPLAVEAAEARTAAAAAEEALREETERRMAAETERRRRIDRVRRSRDGQSVGFKETESKVAKARRKKLEKNVSTYLAARLLRMPRGHKNPRFVFQVDMDVESLNRSECFVLDMGDKIYLYKGDHATPFDNDAAARFADYLEKAKNGAASLELEPDMYFWKLLNGTIDEVRDEATEVGEKGQGDIMSPGGVAYLDCGDGTGWARATTSQIQSQVARVTTR